MFAWFVEAALFGRDGFLQLRGIGQGLLALDFFAGGGAVERLDLSSSEFAEGAGRDIEDQRAVADAADLFDVVTYLLEHLAQLAVAALGEGDLEPGVFAAADLLDLCGLGEDAVAAASANLVEAAAVDHDAAAEVVDSLRCGRAGDFDEVGLFYSRCCFGELVGEVAVVGHEQQAFRQVIETPDGVEARELHVLADGLLLRVLAEELEDGGAMLGVVCCGDVAARLVDHEVALRLGAVEQLAVDADVVFGGVGAGAEFGDDLAVDDDAAFEDDLFGLAAAGDAGLGEDLLQAVAARGFAGFLYGGLAHGVGFLTAEGLVAVGGAVFSVCAWWAPPPPPGVSMSYSFDLKDLGLDRSLF